MKGLLVGLGIVCLLGCARRSLQPRHVPYDPDYGSLALLHEELKGRKDIAVLRVKGPNIDLEMKPGGPIARIHILHKPGVGYEASVPGNDTVYTYRRVAIEGWFNDKVYQGKLVDSSVVDASWKEATAYDPVRPSVRPYLFRLILMIYRRPRKDGVYVLGE